MRRGLWGALVVLAAVCAMLFAFATAAGAAQNPECLGCHETLDTWSVGSVNLGTACKKCHTPGLIGAHPYHHGGNCKVCHSSWGDSNRFAIPTWSGAEGSFASAQSKDTTASILHVIHATPRWMASVSTSVSECSSCHQPAACDACHAAPSAKHAPHAAIGTVSYPKHDPWVGTVARGIVGEDQTQRTATTGPVQCGSAGCHDLAGTQSRSAAYKESHSFPAYPATGSRTDIPEGNSVTTSGTWRLVSGGEFTLGVVQQSNYANASITATFTGTTVEVVTDKDPYRGIFEVWVDGAFVTNVDCYSAISAYEQVVWRSNTLAVGNHTITVKVKGTKNASARGTWVRIDAFRIYSTLPATIAPKCISCHPDRTTQHGTSYSHEASLTAGNEAGFTCNQCHDLKMIIEHKRPSAVTAAAPSVCDQCHTTYAPYSLTTPVAFDFTCGWNPGGGYPGCHQPANGQAKHVNIVPSHDSTAAASVDCRSAGCHGSDLRAIHNNSITTNTYVTSCLTCHGVDKYPTSTNCVDSNCHTSSGVTGMDTHPTPAHIANPGAGEALRTGGKACTTCHELDLTTAHFKSAAKTSGSNPIACNDCHGAAYFPAGWLTPPNNTCVACHPADALKAGAPHEAADYAAKHDFTAYGTNQASCGAGGTNQSFCHTVSLADFIHDPSNPRHVNGGDCTSCHTAAAKTGNDGVPVTTTCAIAGCHTALPHNLGKHLVTGSNECFKCHEKSNGAVTNDVRDVHPSCETCHANVSYPNVTLGLATADCINCHKAGSVGTHPYSPTDPSHYAGSESTHTASSQAGTYSGYACTSCHNMEMKPEHILKTKTNFAGVPTTYPDKCVACHEQRVDSLAGGVWNKTCDQCHATKHTGQTTMHNATNQALSGILTTATAESEDFGTSSTWPADWTTTATVTYVKSQNTSAVAGFAAEISTNTVRTEYNFYKDLNLSSYEGTAVLTFWYSVNISSAQDFLVAEYSTNGGSSYTELLRRDTDQLAWAKSADLSIPATGTVRIRFRGTFNASGEYGRVDDIKVDARQRGASPGTAGLNCGGGSCHNVADVSFIHSNSIPTNSMNPSCLTCHNPTPVQATKDCNAAGCHNGGHNMAVHTANASPECVGCHESNNTQAVHPTCNTCHANASYPNIVVGSTAECIDCHNALQVGAKAYDPADPQHYAASVTTHTAIETGTFQSYQCTWCHRLELKPEHQKTSVNIPGYNATLTEKCIGCHELKVDAFTGPWDKRCASCHALTHSERASKHNASVVGAACGGTGCHNVADVSIVHNNSISTNGATMGDNNCATANCHADGSNAARPDSVPQTLDCNSAGCHLGLVHSHSLNRTGSDYNNSTITGCTNSGAGCHGTDTGTTQDYAQYHPTSGCTTGPCHQANATQVDPAFNNPQTCQNCHGGRATAPLIYDRAPDAVSLTTATPNGHYGEATHTAAGLLNTAKAKADGLTTATCTTCHNPIGPNVVDGLWYQHQVLQGVGNTTCTECHSNPAYPGVTAEVVGNWTTDACADCHNVTDMPAYAQHATSTAPVVLGTVVQSAASPGPCGDCHTNLDLHELHKGNGLSGSGRLDPQCNVCHDPLKQGWKPVERSCGDGGACHITQPHLNIGPAHSVTALSQACIECHETTDLRINHGYTSTCGDANNTCHNNPAYPTLPVGKQECVDCHNGITVGSHPYAPHDPQHYTGTETTHTATAQTGTFGGITSVVATETWTSATWPGSWTRSNATRVFTNNVLPYQGTYYAQISNTGTTRQTDYFQRVFDTSNASSPTVTFYYQTLNFGASDYARLEYSTDGVIFTQLWNVTAIQSTWTTVGPVAVPRSATLTLRWSASTDANNSDMLRADSITVKPGDGDAAACSACHRMELRPEHFKPSSDATRVPSIYSDKCVDCHENKVDAIGAAWDHKCTACHPVNTQHNGEGPKHDASAIAPECGGSGCHFIQDVAVIHNNSSTSNPLYTNCTNTCHTSANVVPQNIDCDASGCHLGVQPHTHELDVTASDYNNTTVTGCTDSGAGCHGSVVTSSYVDYHPNSGCTTGPCHTAANHNALQFNNPNSCQNCHGGGALLHDNSIDVVGLTEASPAGHYGETTHTAAASSRTATMSAGGTITARCIDCHNDVSVTGIDGLFAQHQGLPAPYTNTGCWECHSNPLYPAATAEIVGNWTTNNCADCHNSTDMGAGFAQHSAVAPSVLATEAQGVGTCQTTGCHTTLDLHALHKGTASTPPARLAAGCALAACHDYTKQGRKPTGKTCGTGGACHASGTVHPNEAAAHQSPDTATCFRCHEGPLGVAVTDVRDVNKSAGFGNGAAHTCASCHNGGLNLGSTNTADCVDCHNASEAGTHAYTPYDPNHYYTTSHDSSATSSDNWSTANYGTSLLDFHGASVSYSRACTGCHTIDLRTEHEKTSISYNLGGKPDKCVACHEGNGTIAGVDNWSARWAGGCGGEASNCHNLSAGVLHNNWDAKHNASTEVMSSPGRAFSLGTASTLLTEGFESGNFTANAWTTSRTGFTGTPRVNTGSVHSGTYKAELYCATNGTRRTGAFLKSFNTSSYSAASVTFWYTTVGFAGGSDYAQVSVSTDGTTYTTLMPQITTNVGWTQATYSLPIGATVYVSFDGSVNATTEFVRYDDIVFAGSTSAALGSALPANSTAATSCSSNPNATQCHDVTDVADVHSKTANSGCPICHTGTTQHPSNKNCQATGCHVGINVNEHVQSGTTPDYHESPMVSNTAGPLAGTGATATWCNGCHDDSIANEHFALGSYGTSPCSMCHKKSSNSGAPTSVTSVNTSSTIHGDTTPNNELCTDCHTTVTKTAPHIQRAGDAGTPGTQFADTWSGHKIYDTMYGSRTGGTGSTFNGQTTSITWSLPTATSWLKAGYQSFTMTVRCSDCHGTVTGATGPHGGAMQVKLAAGYDNSYSTGALYINASNMSNTTNICAKCHTTSALGYNNVHSRAGDHQGTPDGKCINCHVKTPHAWKRPRLIGYTTDSAPYKSLIVTGITQRSYTPTGWQFSYCGVSGCGQHPATPTTPVWP